jgi:uncharacterized protein YdeI (YjbR/CyaY-like superfamily)
METFKEIPIYSFKDAVEWEEWIALHYGLESGIWLKMAKKNSGITTVTYQEALEVALCYGWIDGQANSYDETYYLQKYTPRRRRSLWSKINIGRAEELIAAGKMRESGFAAIEAAKADGRWDAAYDSVKEATVPSDLAAVFERNEAAKTFFESLNSANRYAVLWRLMTANTPEKRAARLGKLVKMLEEGKTFH